MLISIIIRTLNEEKHLDVLLSSIEGQEVADLTYEIIVVDSGSDDHTLQIATSHGCQILHITREEFSFGRSLNMGCEAASGELLVMVSGHCVPTNKQWLKALCQPLIQNEASYVYGRQIGSSDSYYSERRIFSKYYPEKTQIPQEGFFCNNANSAITRTMWERYRFDEELTGLEDMELAKRLANDSGKLGYIAEACVCHFHDESWHTVKRRFEREAIALQKIMPQIHIHKLDFLRYIVSSVWLDWKNAKQESAFLKKAKEIVQYRFYQYWGSYVGNHDHRKLSHAQKDEYFYPHTLENNYEEENRRVVTDES
ncbi:MAG: glycosyltransferase [Nitrospirales bacterium]|nr:glycosyltransferase [Nitrospirales bacterium]